MATSLLQHSKLCYAVYNIGKDYLPGNRVCLHYSYQSLQVWASYVCPNPRNVEGY